MVETIHLDIKGMHCSACSARIEKSVSKMDGIFDVTVNLATEKGRVVYDTKSTNKLEILQRIKKLGFIPSIIKLNTVDKHDTQKTEIVSLTWKVIFSIIFALPLVMAMLIHFDWMTVPIPTLFLNPWFQLALATPVQFIIAFPFYEGAWNAVKNRGANMDVLVVLSTTAAYFYSHYLTFHSLYLSDQNSPINLHFETSVLIITFVLIGKLMEAKTKRKTLDAINSLNKLKVNTATLLVNGFETTKPIHQILPGDIILTKPGERIPIDGQVMNGFTSINESLLTGEGIPVEKGIGDAVYAGTINHNSVIKIKATKLYSETILSKIINIVEEAQFSKPPIQNIADRFTAIFVPIVLFLAISTFFIWYFALAPGRLNEALEKMIAVLIISCPCALGLATPMSIMVGSGRAAKLGILIKEGKVIEFLSKNNIVVLDKTGTITKGEPLVTDLLVRKMDQTVFLQLVGAIEKGANHPVGNAILNAIERKVNRLPEAENATVILGHGIQGMVNEKRVIIANAKYFELQQTYHLIQVLSIVKKLEHEGKTVMVVSVNDVIHGIIAVADEVKSSSKHAVNRLKNMGLEVVLLSGDNHILTKKIAKKMGIKTFQAEVTPQRKAEWIKSSQKDGNKIIMVGDGINDAPALSVADIGVAIGTGADIAIETGDVTIMNGDLNRLVDAIIISKKTMSNIKQNFTWAFIYNFISIPLAIIGILPPWFASAAMAFSSVSVVLNSLRLKNI
jgi:P-type Cu+ transporter